MKKTEEGGAAFPDWITDGMTLRDWFAGNAPPMTEQWWEDSKGDHHHHWVDADAAWRYFHADAMIKAREEKKETK